MSELTRQERFSESRQVAKALVADSIITDATAQFLALIIQEIHDTKIAPLQSELKRRADLPPTLSAAMELPEVKARIEAAYLAGFNSSGEGWNGEYPFHDNNQDPTQDNHWAACRDAALAAIKEIKA